MSKTLDIISTDDAIVKIPDLKVWGDGDLFKLLSKTSSKKEDWMEATFAMLTTRGCVVKVLVQQGNNISVDTCYVPDVSIIEERSSEGSVISRKLG